MVAANVLGAGLWASTAPGVVPGGVVLSLNDSHVPACNPFQLSVHGRHTAVSSSSVVWATAQPTLNK